jgi:hypothetical protein
MLGRFRETPTGETEINRCLVGGPLHLGDDGTVESLQNFLERDRTAMSLLGEVEEMEPLLIDRPDDPGEDLPDETLARAEVIVHRRDVDLGRPRDLPQRDIAEPVLGNERLRRIEDAGDYTNTADVNFRFLPCMASGLAYYIALKKAPDRVVLLKQIYEEDWARTANSDVDRASYYAVPDVRGNV